MTFFNGTDYFDSFLNLHKKSFVENNFFDENIKHHALLQSTKLGHGHIADRVYINMLG